MCYHFDYDYNHNLMLSQLQHARSNSIFFGNGMMSTKSRRDVISVLQFIIIHAIGIIWLLLSILFAIIVDQH